VIVDDAMGLRWSPLARLCTRVFARKARDAREGHKKRDGEPYRPLIWREKRGGFHKAEAYDVSRQDPDTFSPFDLCETTCWLDAKDGTRGRRLLADCITCVTGAFPRAGKGPQQAVAGIGTDDIVALVGTALRQSAEHLDGYWRELWTSARPLISLDDLEKRVETTMRRALEKDKRLKNRFSWIARNRPQPTSSTGELVFIAEPISGRRNLRSGVPIYCVALAAARRASNRLVPICSGIHVPSVGHLYIGISPPSGGAALIDERLGDVHALRESRSRDDVTVGIHHSRRVPGVSHEFVARVSKLLPRKVDKELALGSGALHLALTATGGLAAFFDPAIQACSAYPGAILLCAATGRPDAVTDLAGRPWLEGDPLTKEGILAWSDPVLRKQIERKLLRRAQGM
jgi:fructose-1,6-bisphosphatase/inositol monophosphatase family enzyme